MTVCILPVNPLARHVERETMDLTSAIVQELDTDVRQDPGAWKDRFLVSALCFGGAITIGWCGALGYGAWWVVAHVI